MGSLDMNGAELLLDKIVMMTNGPAATVGEILSVELPRTRQYLELANNPEYRRYNSAVLELLYQKHRKEAA